MKNPNWQEADQLAIYKARRSRIRDLFGVSLVKYKCMPLIDVVLDAAVVGALILLDLLNFMCQRSLVVTFGLLFAFVKRKPFLFRL